ncbi:MAG: glycoside hydrolase family 15 protein [Bryobacteraceae bacterium]|nr:glycoside hydrolase family 15 protein [Bryobacteraceae bacterium]
MSYLPIEDYGIIGDMHTAALVGKNGSIDWFCYPRFDSPSIFAALLDDKKGGSFCISPVDTSGVVLKQFYWPDTNVLVTRFLSVDGVGQVVDFMPIVGAVEGNENHRLIRRVEVIKGEMKFRVRCRPAFNYARDPHTLEIRNHRAIFRSRSLSMALEASVALERDGDGVVAEFVLKEAEQTPFELYGLTSGDGDGPLIQLGEIQELFEETVNYWRRWLSQSQYRGRWREMVNRSALVQKLLIYAPTGAIIAAPTTSLPESIGGPRNWDYRYTWIRDSAFTVYSLIRLGFTQEAACFVDWVDKRCHELEPDGSLQVLYGIDGRKDLEEEILDLDGYKGSRPVRIGNNAYNQLQLDIYGELMDAAYLSNKYGKQVTYGEWVNLRRLVEWVSKNWDREDEGIWEVRSGRQHFVYSKMMCWVCLDRAIRLAEKRSLPSDREQWRATRDRIYEEVQKRGWSDMRNAFVQAYGSDSLDASLLMMPLVFFMAPSDPRMLATLDAINQPRSKRGLVTHGLVYRYNHEEAPDGFTSGEGTFNCCSFWLVEAMTRAGLSEPARLQQARLLFEEMLGYANHLGLYAEQIGPHGEALGNFPQALTHMALISAAFNLDRALDRKGWPSPPV